MVSIRPIIAQVIVVGFLLMSGMHNKSAYSQQTKGNTADPFERIDSESTVGVLFKSFRDGEFHSSASFPDLKWDDVSDLLMMASSQRSLSSFPSNPLSSFRQSSAHEGIVALWLIEGLRQGGPKCGGPGGRFPSLNPRCFSTLEPKGGGSDNDESNDHAAMLKQYRSWWDQVSMLPPEEAKQVEALEGSDLRWH